jgi:hypothetical protein
LRRRFAKIAAKSDRLFPAQDLSRAVDPKAGLVSIFLIFEIKDLTYNAQFNFCLSASSHLEASFFDRSEFAHSAPFQIWPELALLAFTFTCGVV